MVYLYESANKMAPTDTKMFRKMIGRLNILHFCFDCINCKKFQVQYSLHTLNCNH